MGTIVQRVSGGYEHGRLYATDSRGRRRRLMVWFMDHCRGVGNEELERTFGIPVITTEFIELLVWYSRTESICADFCTINGVLRLFLILDPELQNTLSSLVRAGLYYSHTFEKISSLMKAAFLKPVMSTV
jgi:hypothetical protein